MKRPKPEHVVCTICGRNIPPHDAIAGEVLRESIRRVILKDHPEWSPDGFICRDDLTRFRSDYITELLQSEKREVTTLEQQVIDSLREHELLSENVESQFEHEWSFGQRLADRVAEFGGSWPFLISFAVFLVIWIAMNSTVVVKRPADPYPFILLNLILSCIAAVQAPIIMMSQKRQEAKDRLRSQHDYKVNLKAELEIRHLHEKVDHLLSQQWERLVEVQELQLELLEELGRTRGR